MILLLPIFPTNDVENQLLLETLRGKPLASFALKHVAACKENRALVLTNQDKIVEYSRALGLPCDFVNPDLSLDPGGMVPPGTSTGVRYVLDKLQEAEDEIVCIVDYRNPGITRSLIEQAKLEYFQSNPSVLISVREAVDHPAQVDRYYRILGIEVLCFLEEDEQAESILSTLREKLVSGKTRAKTQFFDMVVSKPFHFNWGSYRIQSDRSRTGLYARIFDKTETRLIPIEAFHRASHPNKERDVVWLYRDGFDTARRLVNRELLVLDGEAKILAVPFLRPVDFCACVLIGKPLDRVRDLYINSQLVKNDLLVRTWGFCQNAFLTDAPGTARLSGAAFERTREIGFNSLRFLGPACSLNHVDGVDGYILTLLERVDRGRADFAEPFQPTEKLWEVDPQTKRRKNLTTGNVILGRQDFPPVFQIDGSLVIGKCRHVTEMGRILREGDAQGFLLAASHAGRVQSKIDLARMRAQPELVEC